MVTELPSGTVTFLFTDLEGSTQMLTRLRDRYGEVLAGHRRLLRGAVAEHGGEEIDTQGDAFFFAFRRAKDAAAAAVTAQRAISTHVWPEGGVPRVRMGMHTGEPSLSEEGYFGLGVHRASRICSVGHGGQILVSRATCSVLEDGELEELELRDLGEHRLKGLDRPERIYQLIAPGLPADFPALTTAAAEAPFAGREGELAEAARVAVVGRISRRRGLLLVALVGVVAAAIAVPLFAFGGTPSSLSGIEGNALGAISPITGCINDQIAVRGQPTRAAIGEGAVWVVANAAAGVVYRVDPARHAVVQQITVGSGPSGIAIGGGSVWVANALDGTVMRINPTTDAVVQTIPVGTGPRDIAAGPDAVWVANRDDGTVSRIDIRSGTVRNVIPVGVAPSAIAVDRNAVWVADQSNATVYRIDPSTNQIVQTIHVGNGASAITVGLGSVWVANALDGTLWRINPSTNQVAGVISVGNYPTGVAVAGNGVWVANKYGGKLVRVDPRTNTVTRTIRTGNLPADVTAHGGAVWVTVEATGASHRGGTLTIVGKVKPESFDPGFEHRFDSSRYLIMTVDSLIAFQKVGGSDGDTLVPDLATTIPAPSDAGRTYTFKLRPGIRYSNGALVKPDDFRRAVERILAGGSADAFEFANIVGASSCTSRGARCDLSRGIVTDNAARTVTYHLVKPDPLFLPTMAAFPDQWAPVLPGTPDRNLGTSHPIPGTGPYMISRYSPGHELVFVRNPYFHEWSKAAQPAGYPDKIVQKFGLSLDAQLNEIEQGRADTAIYLPSLGGRLSELVTQYPSQLHTNPQAGLDYVGMNMVPPFDNVNVRRALAYAIDRRSITPTYGGSRLAQPTCQIEPPNFPGYQRYCPFRHDLAKAKRLVQASGTTGMTVTVWSPKFDPYPSIARYTAKLLVTLGYRASVKLANNPSPIFNYPPHTRVQLYTSGNFFSPPVAAAVLPSFSCASGTTPSGFSSRFCNKRIDAAIQQALHLQLTAPQAANRLWAKIDRLIVNSAPIIPLVNGKWIEFVSKRVGDYQYHPAFAMLLDQLWVH
jgi:YVTN family beta-propeller protein